MDREKAFDFKKEYREFYLPKTEPALLKIPAMKFIMVDGVGDPGTSPAFSDAVSLLYGLSYTIKMSKKSSKQPEGYFEYVVPPLEGLWCVQDGPFALARREDWQWTLMLRQPEFVSAEAYAWACAELTRKKHRNPSAARLESFEEGLCVQILHKGPYAAESASTEKLTAFCKENALVDTAPHGGLTMQGGGLHHEIYLSDPRRAKPEAMRTVLRHPVQKAGL